VVVQNYGYCRKCPARRSLDYCRTLLYWIDNATCNEDVGSLMSQSTSKPGVFVHDRSTSIFAKNVSLKTDPWAKVVEYAADIYGREEEVYIKDDADAARAEAERQHAEEIARLTAEWESLPIIEVAIRNRSVSDYMDHWEGRALKAEAECERLRAELSTALRQRVDEITQLTSARCVWTDERTTCDYPRSIEEGQVLLWSFCPYCGKSIEVSR